MAKRQMKQQSKKTEKQESTPSAADFLNQKPDQKDGPAVTDASADYSEQNQPEDDSYDSPQDKAPEQKPAKNVRETMKRKPRRGDPCPTGKCPGKLISYSRSRKGNRVTLFLECSACKAKPTPNKQVITS